MLTALCYQRVDEALVGNCDVDLLARHEVDKILERAFEPTLIGLPHVSKNPSSLQLGNNDLELVEDLLHTLGVCQLVLRVFQVGIDH
jgi:hypothetical protein